MTLVSIIITTCNRAEDLGKTLVSLGKTVVPEAMLAELLIVDNGSRDHTEEVVTSCRVANMALRYIREDRPGKSQALNTGLELAKGEILLFTDDDVRVDPDWISGMCAPILSGKADAVRGTILLAPNLRRPWMTPSLLGRLAHNPTLAPGEPVHLVGANMAVARRVFGKVTGFDTELGPGSRAPAWEDALFSWQVERAGFRLVPAEGAAVIHHPMESRLTRKKFLESARKNASAEAYIRYHWQHIEANDPLRQLARAGARLIFWRVKRWREWRDKNSVAGWEIDLVQEFYRHWYSLTERCQSRKYERFGLAKVGPVDAPSRVSLCY